MSNAIDSADIVQFYRGMIQFKFQITGKKMQLVTEPICAAQHVVC
jgi:hypothetical protein